MSKARLVITAVVLEGRSQSEVTRAYGVSQPWVSRLVARYRVEGEAAFKSRSRRPAGSPSATAFEVVELALRLRKELLGQGLDAGATRSAGTCTSTTSPLCRRRLCGGSCPATGRIVPEPKKRPRSSHLRFEAEVPNQMWQSDFTHYRLATGQDVEILNFLDDRCRYLLACVAFPRVTGPAVMAVFGNAVRRYEAGWSLARIGEHLNVDPTTVLSRLRERGVPTRDTHGRLRS